MAVETDEQTKGERTRTAILDQAARLATVDGLEGLTIGHLALATSMSKSGLYAHFGSKQELQLATIDAARATFVNEVLRPALRAPKGIKRLLAACDAYLSHIERRVFPGRLLLLRGRRGRRHAARPGPQHDRHPATRMADAARATRPRSDRTR